MQDSDKNLAQLVEDQLQRLGEDMYVKKWLAREIARGIKTENNKIVAKKTIQLPLARPSQNPFDQHMIDQENYQYQQNKYHSRIEKIGTGPKGQQIYRLTDFYLPFDHFMQKTYQQKINKFYITDFKKKKEQQEQKLDAVLAKWVENLNSGNLTNQRQFKSFSQRDLQKIVNELGQSKKNFFLHYKNNTQLSPLHSKNVPNPMQSGYFIQSLKNYMNRVMGPVTERKMQIEKQQTNQNKKDQLVFDIQLRNKQQLWGQIKDQSGFKNTTSKIQEEKNQNIIKNVVYQNSYYNPDLLNGSYKKPVKELARIQLDLNNPNYYLTKVNTCLQNKQKINKVLKDLNEKTDIKKKDQTKKDISDIHQTYSKFSGQKTLLSGAKFDNNPQLSLNIILQRIINSQKISHLQFCHSPIAQRLYFNKFRMQNKEFKDYHRFYFKKIQKKKQQQNRIVKIVPHTTKSKHIGSRINSQKIQSFHKFQTVQSLSCKEGTVILCEHIQQHPLLLSNPGMASKMIMYVDKARMINQTINKATHLKGFDELDQKNGEQLLVGEQGLKLWREELIKQFGPLGGLWLSQNGSTSLMGQSDNLGCLVVQNKLQGHPVVKHKAKNTDFLIVRDDKGKYYLRKMDNLYLCGQIEPRMQIYNPDSRTINSFLLDYLKSYIKLQFRRRQYVNFDDLRQVFKNLTETNIRKTLASLDTITNDNKNYILNNKQQSQNLDVTPQQVCLYQKMQSYLYKLKQFGLQQLRSPQKIKSITNTYFKRNPKILQKFTVSKLVAEELYLCPWYLSSSYLSCLHSGKLQLQGHGDPTNGHGGISFVKKPLKKRLDKDQEPDEDKNKGVTGTTADLRKLKNQQASELLRQRGVSQYQINKMNRWQKVDYLKQIAPNEQLLNKFVRQERATKKMQKEKYQKDINKLFNQMLKNISIVQECDLDQVEINSPLQYTLDYYLAIDKPIWQTKKNKLRFLKVQKIEN